MHQTIFRHRHNTGEIVYHSISGQKGIVVDLLFTSKMKTPIYTVSFGEEESHSECEEVEIVKERPVHTY